MVVCRMHLLSTYHVSGPLPGTRNMKMNIQSSLSPWCSLPKAITIQDGKCYNQSRRGVLQSTEKVPKANLVERGCSENFHGEVTCYLSLQGLEEDSWQQEDREWHNIQEEEVTFSQRRWIQGIVNNLATGKGGHKGSRRKSIQRERLTKNKNWMVNDFSQEVTKLDTHLRRRTLAAERSRIRGTKSIGAKGVWWIKWIKRKELIWEPYWGWRWQELVDNRAVCGAWKVDGGDS